MPSVIQPPKPEKALIFLNILVIASAMYMEVQVPREAGCRERPARQSHSMESII